MNADFSKLTNEQARKTAVVVAGVLLLISCWGLYRERFVLTAILIVIAVGLIVTGFFFPPLAKRFHIIWMTIAFALGWVNSRILLIIIFFTIFVPYGFLSRLFQRDPLKRRDAPRETYWIKREKARQEKEGFERLF
jgi:hypothetical protein